jgi:hypothetical protein
MQFFGSHRSNRSVQLKFRIELYSLQIFHVIIIYNDIGTVSIYFLLLIRRKKEARQAHEMSTYAQKVTGLKAKLYHKQRHSEKVQLKKK